MRKNWENLLDTLSQDESSPVAYTFLKQCVFLEESNNSAIIACAGDMTATYIKKNELEKIENYISDEVGFKVTLSVVVNPELLEETGLFNENEKIENESISTEDIKAIKEATRKKSNLDGYYKFENFVIGSNNKYVVAAAEYVSTNAGKEYNPFYIYGGVGLGKTHILKSIGNSFIERNPKARIAYIGGGAFRDEFVSGLMSKRPDIFKKKYRSLDMLLLDDLQLLETAQETSKELFEIFQALDADHKQMVFVSDRPPKELQNIEARLKSRFEKSLILSIEPPEFETRVAIINCKLEDLYTSIPKEIVEYMAQNITSDVRKIEGAIKAYLLNRDIMKITPSVEEAINSGIFKNYITTKATLNGATIKSIIKTVADYYGVQVDVFRSRDRSKYVSKIRHVAMYLSSEYSGKSTTEIGLEFNRDHASVIYAREKVRAEVKANLPITIEIERIIASIPNS